MKSKLWLDNKFGFVYAPNRPHSMKLLARALAEKRINLNSLDCRSASDGFFQGMFEVESPLFGGTQEGSDFLEFTVLEGHDENVQRIPWYLDVYVTAHRNDPGFLCAVAEYFDECLNWDISEVRISASGAKYVDGYFKSSVPKGIQVDFARLQRGFDPIRKRFDARYNLVRNRFDQSKWLTIWNSPIFNAVQSDRLN